MNSNDSARREAFLTRVRQAARAGQAFRVYPGDETAEAAPLGRIGGRCEDLCEAMAAEVDEVGGQAHLVDDHGAAQRVIAELLAFHGAKQALTWQHEVLDRLKLPDLLTKQQVQLHHHDTLQERSREQQRQAFLACDVGITSCDVAIAETGSLMACSRPGQERVASLVTPVHIAVIERQQIVPDLFDAFDILREQHGNDLPSNVVLITGPSKTGDIELTLTTGVHGPGVWHVIIIREG